MYENQSLLDSHPDLLVPKYQKIFNKRCPKDQNSKRKMGGQKLNPTKMAVEKIELE